MMKGRKGPLVALEYPGGQSGGMTAARYQEQVLKGVLLGFWRELSNKRGEVLLQQDNASLHTAKTTVAWFKAHEIRYLPSPASSPNLNLIEQLWHLLKEIIWGLEHAPMTVDELKDAIQQVCNQITVNQIDNYARSMYDIFRGPAG